MSSADKKERAEPRAARSGSCRERAPQLSAVAAARTVAARAAVAELHSGMTLGLGSGRAVAAVIELAAQRWPSGPPLLAVVASSATDALARAAGFAVVSLDELDLKRNGSGDAGGTRRRGVARPRRLRRPRPPASRRCWTSPSTAPTRSIRAST